MTRTRSICLTLLAVFLMPVAANAVPITYQYEGEGAGVLDGIGFDGGFVITAFADTDDILPWASADIQVTHISTTISIEGFGTFTITTPSHTWIAEGCCGGIGADLGANWITLNEAAFADVGYTLDTNFGPVTDNSPSNVNQFNNVNTDGGILSFETIDWVTFSSVVSVPEPGTLALLGIGLAGMGFARRRRKT